MSDAYLAPAASHRYVLDLVRGADRDRFLGALFAPEPARSDLLALLAFDHELARTRTVTREPMLARIRLEWRLNQRLSAIWRKKAAFMLENLTLLCPNCHVLTATWRRRKR